MLYDGAVYETICRACQLDRRAPLHPPTARERMPWGKGTQKVKGKEIVDGETLLNC
jgi:hypothetical protein